MAEIKLGRYGDKGVALIDDADFADVDRWTWRIHSGGYIYRSESGTSANIFLHRYLMNPPPDLVVDHINGDRTDNRRCNLRICNQRQNVWASKKSWGKSGIRGVRYYEKTGKWHARAGRREPGVYINIHLGVFDTREEAAAARVAYELETYGEFAPVREALVP